MKAARHRHQPGRAAAAVILGARRAYGCLAVLSGAVRGLTSFGSLLGLSLVDTHGHVVAALLAEMQSVKGSACFLSLARRSFVTRSAYVREEWKHQFCGDGLPNMSSGNQKTKWKDRGWEMSFGGESDINTYCGV